MIGQCEENTNTLQMQNNKKNIGCVFYDRNVSETRYNIRHSHELNKSRFLHEK